MTMHSQKERIISNINESLKKPKNYNIDHPFYRKKKSISSRMKFKPKFVKEHITYDNKKVTTSQSKQYYKQDLRRCEDGKMILNNFQGLHVDEHKKGFI